jgi:4-alpha-glucanotransferase
MNTPGREEGNWSWRLEEGRLDEALAERLREATAAANRLPQDI